VAGSFRESQEKSRPVSDRVVVALSRSEHRSTDKRTVSFFPFLSSSFFLFFLFSLADPPWTPASAKARAETGSRDYSDDLFTRASAILATVVFSAGGGYRAE